MRKGIIYVYFNRAKYEKEGIEKFYVGQTIGTMEQRASKDGSGYNWKDPSCNSKFAKSIRKWGWDAFEGIVLEEVYEEDLDELEKFYIEQFDSYKNGYNSTLGGDGARGHNPYDGKTEEEMKEIKEKMSKSMKKHYEDPEERKKTGEASKTYWEKPESRKRQSKISKTYWEKPESRKRQSKSIKKRWEDPKRRKIQSEKLSGEKSGRARSVYCRELNIIFSYVELAKKYCRNVLNIKIGQIDVVCNGKTKSAGRLYDGTKLTWKYTEDVEQETLNNTEYIDSEKYEEIIQVKLNENKKIY